MREVLPVLLKKINQIKLKLLISHRSTTGTAKEPAGVIMAPGAFGPSTGTIKLRGIPVLLLISTG